ARSITSVAFDAGFGDLSYFNRTFRRRFGDTPSGVRSTIARHGPAPTLGDAIVKSITQTSLETGRSFAPVQADPATRSYRSRAPRAPNGGARPQACTFKPLYRRRKWPRCS